MVCTVIWKETGEEEYGTYAEDLFNSAIESFSKGEQLLRFLGEVCRLRQVLFLAERQPKGKEKLNQQLQNIKQVAAEMNLPISFTTPEDVFSFIRFNYW